MTQEEALRMALEALEADELDMVDDGSGNMVFRKEQAITAIKKALAQEKALQTLHDENERLGLYKDAYAQPEHEPVALEAVYETIIHWDEGGGKRSRRELARRIVSLYTIPPQRT